MRSCPIRNFWQPLLARGAKIARFGDSRQSAIDIITPLLRNRGFTPQITIETQIQGKRLVDTEAGKEVNVNLEEAVKAHKSEMADLTTQHDQALAEKDAELAEMIEEEKRRVAAELETMKSERELLRAKMEDRSRTRKVMRWIARGTAAAAATIATIATAGAAAGAGAAFYAGVETLTQVDRALERDA